MIKTVQPNDGIDKRGFIYYARMEGYAKLSSDINELSVIAPKEMIKYETVHCSHWR